VVELDVAVAVEQVAGVAAADHIAGRTVDRVAGDHNSLGPADAEAAAAAAAGVVFAVEEMDGLFAPIFGRDRESCLFAVEAAVGVQSLGVGWSHQAIQVCSRCLRVVEVDEGDTVEEPVEVEEVDNHSLEVGFHNLLEFGANRMLLGELHESVLRG
jgi:hypothetical protein